VLEVIFPLVKPSTNQISSGKLLMSHTGCCGLSPFPPKTTVFHHYHDSQINNDTKQKWSNSNHHLLPLSSSSATLNNLQQRSRVHFGWEAGSPKPVCKLSVHEDTLPWLFPCNFSCSAMDIIYLTLWPGPKKPKEEEIHITARLAMQPYTLPDHSLQNQLQPPAGITQCQSSIQPAQPIQTYSTISGTSKYP
jgi:hypothetical protein